MPASMHDWSIYGDFFSTSEMRAVWDQDAAIQRWLEVEAAISTAQAKLGIIPAEAGEAVSNAAVGVEVISTAWPRTRNWRAAHRRPVEAVEGGR